MEMKFTVYHAINPTFGFGDKPEFPKDYCKVAIVETNSIDDAFRLTNHIDSNWMQNHEVKEIFTSISKNTRSTSVSDVIEDGNGNLFYCEKIGWSKIEKRTKTHS